MAIRDLLAKVLRIKQAEKPMGNNLPFVHLFGYEKSYGAPQPQDFALMVKNYKSWAYACANKNAFSVAKCNLRLYKRATAGSQDKEVIEHPFLELLQKVNPYSNKLELFTITQINLELTGNAYWWMPQGNLGIPGMIWNIPAHWVKIIPDPKEFIAGYVVQVPGIGRPIPFEEKEIVHFKFPSPMDLFYGISPVYAAMYGIDLNNEIKSWGINFFGNNATPSGILYSEDGMNPQAYQRLRDEWNRKYRGTKNAGKIAILENGLKYQQIGSSLKDAKFEDVSREIRDEILTMFGVPASKLGLVEDVNRANADANDYTYQKETILPRLTLIEEKLNEQVLPLYDVGLIVKFDSPVPQDNEFRLREKQMNISSGFSSIDEEREREGLEPFGLPETSVPLIPFNLVPAGQPKPDYYNNNPPPEEAEEEKSISEKSRNHYWEMFITMTIPQEKLFAEVMKRYFQDQHGEVMRNLNKYKEVNNAITKDLSSYILFNLQEANTKLRGRSIFNIRNAYVAGLELGMKDTNSTIDFNLFEPNILRAIEHRVGFFADKINQSTADLIRDQLSAGIAKGESINDIAKRIDNIFQFSEDFRSRRIAQTEVIGASNDGIIRAYQEAGMEAKEWLTARDERVRDSHRIDGQIVGITEDFTTGLGNRLQYPGDRGSGAPPEDVINCRCRVLPVKKKG